MMYHNASGKCTNIDKCTIWV